MTFLNRSLGLLAVAAPLYFAGCGGAVAPESSTATDRRALGATRRPTEVGDARG